MVSHDTVLDTTNHKSQSQSTASANMQVANAASENPKLPTLWPWKVHNSQGRGRGGGACIAMGHPLLVLKLVPSCTTPTAHGTLALLVQFAASPFFRERISLPGGRQLEVGGSRFACSKFLQHASAAAARKR